VFVEKTSLYAGDRIDDGAGVVLGLKEFGFSDIKGDEGGVEVEIESVGIPSLALGQPGELLGVSKNKFDLKSGFVLPIDRQRIQVRIGGKEEGIASLFGVPHVQQDHDA